MPLAWPVMQRLLSQDFEQIDCWLSVSTFGIIGHLYKKHSRLLIHCWFTADVTAAMLVDKTKRISFN